MADTPAVAVAYLLAARGDTAVVEKVSSARARQNTRTSLNKVLIGAVPDRGGRTESMQAPPPEMPSWQQRQPDQGRGGGRGHRGGGGRGGGRDQKAGYQGGGGGYQGGGGGYQGGGGGRGGRRGWFGWGEGRRKRERER